ncbi:MAG TPA: GNAT family N-acetyltransferase, partial [Burkholderiales bacterium]|nr:GNAT family N-acetyltransferase [Burkholderiales bacterium]
MIKVKILNTPELIEDACALLYEVYIEECSWKFKIDNPSQLRIEVKNNRKLLKDRFTDYATWFGAFDEDELIGCGRLCGVDKQNKLEVEKYKSSKVINKYLPQNKDYCFEITRVAVRKKYAGRGAVKRLFLALFKYCEANHCSIIACTFNGYLKYLFKKIEFPLLIENAFKYETHDLNPVNFYFAEYEKSEIKYMIKFLEALFNDKCNKINSKIFKALEIVAPVLPIPLYWHDDNGVVVGINEHALKGIDNSSDIIGKTPYEFYPKEIAEHILTHNMQVMLSGETLSQEEYIEDVSTKQKKYFSSVKSPLYDEDDKVIGIVGSFIDITSEKEAQRLALENEAHKIENERHKTIVEEQEKFRKIVGQMVHDIQSPLASLRTIVESAINVPENDRITLRNAAMSITDITTHMLNKYKNNCNT